VDDQVVAERAQFNEWQHRPAIPPDFDAFPRNNFLPDPFSPRTARPSVTRRIDCAARRDQTTPEKRDIGSVPSKATTFKTTVQNETAGNGYAKRVEIEHYRADKTTTVTVTLTIPQAGSFPV
jgi:hypothetical protein